MYLFGRNIFPSSFVYPVYPCFLRTESSTESEPNKCLSIGLFPFFFFVSFLVLPKCFQPNQVQVYSREKILKCQHKSQHKSQHKMPQSEKSAEVAENCTDVNRTCVKVCCGRRRFPFHGTEQAPTYCAVGGAVVLVDVPQRLARRGTSPQTPFSPLGPRPGGPSGVPSPSGGPSDPPPGRPGPSPPPRSPRSRRCPSYPSLRRPTSNPCRFCGSDEKSDWETRSKSYCENESNWT